MRQHVLVHVHVCVRARVFVFFFAHVCGLDPVLQLMVFMCFLVRACAKRSQVCWTEWKKKKKLESEQVFARWKKKKDLFRL